MGVRDIHSPFNRLVGTIKEVQPLINNPLNGVLIVDTTGEIELEVLSGAISTAEINDLLVSQATKDKIKTMVSQRDTDGNAILASKFYLGGIDLTSATAIQSMEMLIKLVCVDEMAQSINVIFDDSASVLAKVGFLESLDPILSSWNSWTWLVAKEQSEIREVLKTTMRIGVIKAHNDEIIADSALMGRVVFKGVGKADGVAKELYGVTADKLSIADGDGGDMTVSEATAWTDLNVNTYVQTVDMLNETSGMVLLSGRDFENIWELTKVMVDLRNDLVAYRHNNDRVGVSTLDENEILGVAVDRLEKLTVNQTDPSLNPNGVIMDYSAKLVPLDRTLEDNINKIGLDIKVLMRGVLKWFDLSITGYTDTNQFNVEVGE